jgi:5-methylcytosine-specific restriction enzyme A
MDIPLRLATLPNATAYHWRMPGAGRRNPDWEWDEIVLACDLVARNGWRAMPAENAQVIELSELLRRMTVHPLEARRPDFRNPNGVGRKTADIATHHPQYPGRQTHGNVLDEQVMARFLAEPDVMHAVAESIRASVANGEPADFPREVGYDGESEMEGRYLLRWHAYRERNPALRRRKINSVLSGGGSLSCEVCSFDFAQTYGKRAAAISNAITWSRCTSAARGHGQSTTWRCSAPIATA